MPINEQVIDAVVHLMLHYFQDCSEETEVDEDTLAAHSRQRGACEHCIGNLMHETGGVDFADAIGRVWESAVWQAMRARTLEAQEDHS